MTDQTVPPPTDPAAAWTYPVAAVPPVTPVPVAAVPAPPVTQVPVAEPAAPPPVWSDFPPLPDISTLPDIGPTPATPLPPLPLPTPPLLSAPLPPPPLPPLLSEPLLSAPLPTPPLVAPGQPDVPALSTTAVPVTAAAQAMTPAQATTPAQAMTQVLPAIPAASVTPGPSGQPAPIRPPVLPEGQPVSINCPECGAISSVDPTRRDAVGFCPHCDFPLFWAKDRIPVAEPADIGDDSLRRLPGTLGRVEIASVPCPHCNELNLPTAVYCVRCGLSMQLVPPPPPPPPPVPVPAPRPAPVPLQDEPERLWIWWVVLITVFVLAAAALVLAQHWY